MRSWKSLRYMTRSPPATEIPYQMLWCLLYDRTGIFVQRGPITLFIYGGSFILVQVWPSGVLLLPSTDIVVSGHERRQQTTHCDPTGKYTCCCKSGTPKVAWESVLTSNLELMRGLHLTLYEIKPTVILTLITNMCRLF